MSDERGTKEPGSGFTVVDRRGEARPDPAPGAPAPEASGAQPHAPAEAPPPAINFITFLLSLSSSALIQLGEIPDPFTQQLGTNLTAAQQTIDILGLIEQKTKGNLDEEEGQALESILFDLRMRFLKASGRL